MLETKRISFAYGSGPWIFQNLDMHVAPGEVVGLPGPSGRGKTTLARLLAGYLHPRAGQVLCDGQGLPMDRFCPVQLIFQHPELTMDPRWKLGDSIVEGYEPSPALLEKLNIDPHWLGRYPHELSGGELQRLALARAMAPTTRYLLADEMTAMLDANTQAMVWEVVLKWARENGVGILAISHDLHLLDRVADRIDATFAPDEARDDARNDAHLSSAA